MSTVDKLLAPYDYAFPPELIAQAPANPRDSARLLVHDRATGKTTDAVFRDIGKFLAPNTLLVLNRTKVVPAKLLLKRSTGGIVTALSLGVTGGDVRVMANRKLKIGEFLQLAGDRGFTVTASDDKYWMLLPSFPIDDLQKILEEHGSTPLPPYIKHTPLSEKELREEYQSVVAQVPGSIAAPTASLHFTAELLRDLKEKGIGIASITLHVHLGTFATLTEEQLREGKLHTEEYEIDPEALQLLESAKRDGRPIIAVGTTSVRTLESASDENSRIVRPKGSTDLFIREGYKFRLVTGLITNFHVPRSSLLMLVSAFAGRENILKLYRHAVEAKYRLFSFGDAMLIL